MTALDGQTPSPTLAAALDALRLDGAIFFRAEYSEPWAYESPPAELAELLRPGARRLILFHIVARGRCWISTESGDRHWAEAGDVVVLPYGDLHFVGGDAEAEIVPIVTLLDPPPWQEMPVLRYGGGGSRTDIVCGYLHSDDPLFDPEFRAFPPLFVVRPPVGAASRFVEAAVEWALATTAGYEPTAPESTRLPELLVTEVLRLHLSSTPAPDRTWIASFRDPVLAPALAAMHREPERAWTVAQLAAISAVSRSVLDQRFRNNLGQPPIRYLARWRIHVACDLLATTDIGVAAVAHRVGYEAEDAFSRAFKRATGLSPSAWRADRRPRPPQ